MPRSSNLRAILAMVIAMGVLIASDACMKIALADASMFQLAFMRGIAAVSICLVLLLALGQGGDIRKIFNPWVALRGLCEVAANFAFTFAILKMSIADVTAITQTCPLFVLVGAWLVYGERLGTVRIALIAVGIVGALLVAQPGTSAASPFAVLGFVTAIAAAARDLISRKVPRDVPALVVALAVLSALMVAGGAGMLAFETPVVPAGKHVLLMALAGALMVAGHVCVFMAYRIGDARTVAPFMYTLIIWAVLAGAVLFQDLPNALAVSGMALVVLAGLLVIYVDGRERRSERALAAAGVAAV